MVEEEFNFVFLHRIPIPTETATNQMLNNPFCFRDTAECYADQDDDLIFEDFARLRLKGETDA